MPTPEDPLFCKICSRALNRFLKDGVVWLPHREELRGGTAGHRPVPVPLSQLPDVVGVCDFCDRPEVAFIYVCESEVSDLHRVTKEYVSYRDFQLRDRAARVIRQDTEVAISQEWGEHWSACQGCSALVASADLERLITRVTEVLPAKMTRSNRIADTRALLRARYTFVFATLQPGRFRVSPDNRIGTWEPATNTDGAS